MVINIVSIVLPLVSLALGATWLRRRFGHQDEPRLALVVNRQRHPEDYR